MEGVKAVEEVSPEAGSEAAEAGAGRERFLQTAGHDDTPVQPHPQKKTACKNNQEHGQHGVIRPSHAHFIVESAF